MMAQGSLPLWTAGLALGLTDAPWTSASLPCAYEVAHIIQGPPCPFGLQPNTVGTSISPNGRYVCGYWIQCISGISEAFVFDTSTSLFTTLVRPPGVNGAIANDVSDAGLVVGTYDRTGVGFRGFIYTLATAQWSELVSANPNGLGWSFANSINARGAVCGTRSIGSQGDSVNPQTAFIWSEQEGFVDLGVMNGPNSSALSIADDGTTVGLTGSHIATPDTRAFILSRSGLEVLGPVPGGISSAAVEAAQLNRVLISGLMASTPPMANRGFALFDGALIDLGILAGFQHTWPTATDSSGQVFGSCAASPNLIVPFIWRDGQMTNLNRMLPNVSPLLREVYGLSEEGHIIAETTRNNAACTVVLNAQQPRAGDTNCDDVVDVNDLLNVINAWGVCYGCAADMTADAQVSTSDLLLVIEEWNGPSSHTSP